MATDVFAERLVRIRTRFAGNLPGKIDNLDLALPQISGEGETVVESHYPSQRSRDVRHWADRRIHRDRPGSAIYREDPDPAPAHKTRADCHRSRGRVRANRHPAR